MTTPLVSEEIASQPHTWRRAAALADSSPLPARGSRVAVVGCGTSWFIAQAYAARRESLGHGVTDAFAASEFPAGRDYDLVVAISRSGTTTEVLDLLASLRGRVRTLAVIGDPDSPGRDAADEVVVLPFADERSVVQTRFATSCLALLRAHLGEAPADLADQAERALTEDLPEQAVSRRQFTFLGSGWSNGLASEAALKLREAALAWSEAYPAMEYRHGPISIADEGSLVWFFDGADGLLDQVIRTGAATTVAALDPLADLVRAQRLAVELARSRGLDPDRPRNLTRSVIIEET